MERLKSGLLLLIVGIAATPVFAQQAASEDQALGAVAVIGDVQNCGNYPVPRNAPLSIREAVLNAGLLSDSVSVKVIRATQDRAQFTQLISQDSADNGEPVDVGDVLVVQSLSPLKTAVKQNAALRTNNGIFVVSLEGGGIKIGDVLRDTRTPEPAEGQLRVICRFQGQPPVVQARLFNETLHGDVISVALDDRRSIKGFGNMVPSVSEFKSRAPSSGASSAGILIPLNSRPFEADESAGDGSQSHVSSDSQTFQWPDTSGDSFFSQSPAPDVIDTEDSSGTSVTEESDSLIASPISQAELVGDFSDTDAPENDMATSKLSFASESATVAPTAPTELSIGAATGPSASGFNPWNLVFVGGLLLAGTLIWAGTLQPDPDDNTQFIEAAARNSAAHLTRSVSTETASTPPTGLTPAPEIAKPVRHASAIAKEIVEQVLPTEQLTEQPTARNELTETLVASHEWFGGDWTGRVVSDDVIQQASIVQKSNLETSIEAQIEIAASEIAATPIAGTEERNIDALNESESTDLEDLLQNRLPIDLCEAQLPLRIALFGKPAGPRRLRIDAAHTSIPAPHMNLAAENRRGQPVTVNAVTSREQSVSESSGGLDRALHSLQERTES